MNDGKPIFDFRDDDERVRAAATRASLQHQYDQEEWEGTSAGRDGLEIVTELRDQLATMVRLVEQLIPEESCRGVANACLFGALHAIDRAESHFTIPPFSAPSAVNPSGGGGG